MISCHCHVAAEDANEIQSNAGVKSFSLSHGMKLYDDDDDDDSLGKHSYPFGLRFIDPSSHLLFLCILHLVSSVVTEKTLFGIYIYSPPTAYKERK